MSPPRATQKSIAEALGLSRQLVSAILGRAGDGTNIRYAAETRQRVLAEAQRQGYALAPTQARLAQLHVIVANSLAVISDGLLMALADRARHHDVSLQLDVVPPGGIPRLLESADASDAASVVFPLEDNDCGLDRLRAVGTKTLVVNCPTASGPRIDFDEAQGADVLMEWLERARRRHLAFFYPHARVFSVQRLAGLHAAHIRHPGLQLSGCEHGNDAMEQELSAYLLAHPEVDAVLIEHPVMMPLLLQAVQQAGRRVPDDVMVATFFGSVFLRGLCPTSMVLDIRCTELAERMLQLSESACRGERDGGVLRWSYNLVPGLQSQ